MKMADDGGMMAKTRLSQNPFAIKTAAPTRSLADSTEGKDSRPLLAPPTLKWGNECSIPSPAPKVFLRPSPLAEQAKRLAESNIGATSKLECEAKNSEERKREEKPADSSINSLFGSTPMEPESGSSPASFVFGQNLHERVCGALDNNKDETPDSTVPDLSFEAAASLKNAENQQSNGDVQEEEVLGPGPSVGTIETGCQDASSSTSNNNNNSNNNNINKSLTESAEEYQSKQVKRKFSEVTVVTGEEEESNVLQMNCKLFAFDKATSAWQERGRGFLRLNDREVGGSLQSRLVMRTQGSLRVVLNTKVWSAMTVEHPSQKTVRITAMDPEGIKVFLIMASTKDTEQLFSALDWRVTMLKSQEDHSSPSGESLASNAAAAEAWPASSSQNTASAGPPESEMFSHSAACSSSEEYTSLAKRWRGKENNDSSHVVSRSLSSAEDDLSSDSGFPTTEDS